LVDVTKLPQLVSNAGRLNHVVQVLIRFGIAPWLQNIPADWSRRLLRTSSGEDIGDQSDKFRIRLALTERCCLSTNMHRFPLTILTSAVH